jgi:hypothetical protein
MYLWPVICSEILFQIFIDIVKILENLLSANWKYKEKIDFLLGKFFGKVKNGQKKCPKFKT